MDSVQESSGFIEDIGAEKVITAHLEARYISMLEDGWEGSGSQWWHRG
jgi:hypothetical protein